MRTLIVRSNAYFSILVRSKIKTCSVAVSPLRYVTASPRRFWRVKLTAQKIRNRFAILIAFTSHLQNAADVGRISSGTSGVVTRLIGKQQTYTNFRFDYRIIKFRHAYIDSSFERVFFNIRSIEDQEV